jgi:hypothetical protein
VGFIMGVLLPSLILAFFFELWRGREIVARNEDHYFPIKKNGDFIRNW